MTGIISKRKRNNRGQPYEPDGTPGDALCKPGEYAEMTKGKLYRTTQGDTLWRKGRDRDEDDY